MRTKESIIKKLGLLPHPEGGFYKETYRCESQIPNRELQGEYTGDRNVSTMIYYMLTADTFSAFHRIQQDEAWHFYSGDTIELHCISPEGKHSKHLIGNDFEYDCTPQLMVTGGDWFAASLAPGGDYALVGCTVAPGFDFRDFELADREKLIAKYPQYAALIENYTRIEYR